MLWSTTWVQKQTCSDFLPNGPKRSLAEWRHFSVYPHLKGQNTHHSFTINPLMYICCFTSKRWLPFTITQMWARSSFTAKCKEFLAGNQRTSPPVMSATVSVVHILRGLWVHGVLFLKGTFQVWYLSKQASSESYNICEGSFGKSLYSIKPKSH